MTDSARYTIFSIRNAVQQTWEGLKYNGISVIADHSGNISSILRCFDGSQRTTLKYVGFWFPFSMLKPHEKDSFIEFLKRCHELETLDVRSNHDWPADFFEEILSSIPSVKYLHLHDARLNLNCLRLLKRLLPNLYELSIPNCSPGRRSPIAKEFELELESLRWHIRKYSHKMLLNAFVDNSENSLAAPMLLAESNTVFLEKTRYLTGAISANTTDSISSRYDVFYDTIDDTQSNFRAWFYLDLKGRLCILEGWETFETKSDAISSFGLLAVVVHVSRRCGHLVEIVIGGTQLKFIADCSWIENIQIGKCLESASLYPGKIVEVSTDYLRSFHSKLDSKLGFSLTGSAIAFVVDIDPVEQRILVASIIRATTRLTDDSGRDLHEDHESARIVRDYFDVLYVPINQVTISLG